MKINLILFGQGRYVEDCFPSIYDKILSKYDCDVYCHLWWDEYVINEGYLGYRGIYTVNSNLPQIIDTLYKPNKFLIEKQVVNRNDQVNYFMSKYPNLEKYDDGLCYHWIVSQFLAFQNICDLFEWEKYDFIIKWRYDVKPIYFPNLHELDKNKFYPAYSQWPTYVDDDEKFSDAAFLMPNDFKSFSRIFDEINLGKLERNAFAEYYYNTQLKNSNLLYRMIKLPPDIFQIHLL